jgi:hypothetical protein
MASNVLSVNLEKETRTQKELGALLKANDKISEALFILSTSVHSHILDADDPKVVAGLAGLRETATNIRSKITKLWAYPPVKKEDKVSGSVLGHP